MALHAAGTPETKTLVIGLSLVALWTALLVNMVGVRVGKWVSNLGGLSTYAAGSVIVVAGLLALTRSGPAASLNPLAGWDLGKVNFWSQIAFAFGGLELGSAMAGEIRDPRRTVPLAAWISGALITGFYLLGTFAILVLLAPGDVNIITGLLQAGDAAAARAGMPWAPALLTVLILGGILGQLAAWLGGSARIPFVIGIDRYLPEAFSRVHPRWGTPHISILVQGAACTVFLGALQAGDNLRAGYQLLVDMTVITYFVPFLYIFGAAWKHGMRWSAASGFLVTLLGIGFTLVPPPDAVSMWLFEAKLVGGCVVLIALARMVFNSAKAS
jgi:amino acid transporter